MHMRSAERERYARGEGLVANSVLIELEVEEAEAAADELDEVTRRLRAELLELGVESAESVPAGAPIAGTKGDPLTIGALVVAIVPGLLPKLLEFVTHWLDRTPQQRKVRVRLRKSGHTVDIRLDNSKTSLKQALALARQTLGDISSGSG